MLFAVHLQILPVSGQIGYSSEVPTITGFLLIDTLLHGDLAAFGDALRQILLPAITLGLPMTAILMRVTRTSCWRCCVRTMSPLPMPRACRATGCCSGTR